MLIKSMSNPNQNQPDQDSPRAVQELLPLEQVQITAGLPDEAKSKCLKLLEELLRQVIFDDQAKL